MNVVWAMVVAVAWLAAAAPFRPAEAAEGGPPDRPVAIRISWGGGKPHAWSGTIRVIAAETASSVPAALEWQTLSSDVDAAATAHAVGDTLLIHEPARRSGNGVDLLLPRWRGGRLAVRLFPDGDERAAVVVEAAVADLLVEGSQQPLDRDGNRLTLKPAPGDALRVAFSSASRPAERGGPASAIFSPGETVRMIVEPLLPKRSSSSAVVELRMRLKAAPDAEPIIAQAVVLRESASAEAAAESRIQGYEPVQFDLPLPGREGAYDIELETVERGGLRWSRPLATRVAQLVAVAPEASKPDPAGDGRGDEWKVVHELDPGSPRLHERLRRLPGVGMPSMPSISMPAMPLPSMSLPNVGMPAMQMPSVPMPKLPAVALPGMPLPSVASMVPRLSGLLAAGHSTVEAHPLGPMLRLPPARSADEPSWEGIVVAGAVPGTPHLVELEFPQDQRAVIGLTVLEADVAGTAIEPRFCGGFEVLPPVVAAPSGLGRHAFVFWPTTRNPLLLVANPSSRGPALFGRVRISAGPERPERQSLVPAGQGLAAGVGGRLVHAYLPTPDFSRFGAADRPASGAGRPSADWKTFLVGGSHAAEWLAAQGAAGAMVVAYRDGAAIWPSQLTRAAPRWDSGATAEAGLDPARKDLLGLLCRIHAREKLRLIPAVSFDAPLPAVESLLAAGGPEAVGLVSVGRDGRPRQLVGRGFHYNVLDPRVQQAAEDLVREAVERLRGEDAVAGIGLILSHEGWMHLPGTAWGIDDVTFAGFLAETGGQEPAGGSERFARRAALVEGQLREPWLAWRAARVARFHARLAAVVAEHDPRLCLHVVPTTLFTEGDLAARFRPTLAAPAADGDLLLEIGLDPARITADPRILFVSPHVHAPADTLLDRCIVEQANTSLGLARGAAVAARRGVIAVEQPIMMSVAHVVPHGPFSAATATAPVPVHAVPHGAARGRALAESFVAADVEVVFDMGLSFGRVEPPYQQCLQAFASLPAAGLELADELPAPLVVRSRREQGRTVVGVVNAGPVPCRSGLGLAGGVSAVIDIAQAGRLPLDPSGGAAVPLQPWELRTLVLDGGVAVRSVRVEFEDEVRRSVEARLADVRGRRGVLETPRPLEVLDNPGFELAGADRAGAAAHEGEAGGGVGGWELVEASRGAVGFVAGVDAPAGRGIAFSSANGLSTLRSNPFPPPATGRVSVAVWLRLPEGDPQPPLRLALEGVQDGREYYRFAPVGGLAGGKPLTAAWSQFVLQVDDLPIRGLESLRVRFDLLGPGAVQIDGVRVFDLAFDEPQRVQLSRRLSLVEERLAAGDLGACLIELDAYWPRFLTEFVSDDAVAAARAVGRSAAAGPTQPPAQAPAERSGGMLDRVRRWWQ